MIGISYSLCGFSIMVSINIISKNKYIYTHIYYYIQLQFIQVPTYT